jgi:hypothetical protein
LYYRETRMPPPLFVRFQGGVTGSFRVLSQRSLCGAPLAGVPRLAMLEGDGPRERESRADGWTLCGVTGHQRYVERAESDALRARQAGLGRAEATRAALIPIQKSAAWWELAQDERRAIFEARSRHVAGTVKYLPAIARRLHHARELGEPFDFLTWFEYAPEHDTLFDELLEQLRASEEWQYVVREVELKLTRD